MIINTGIMKNPINWITVGLMVSFFVFALREILRLFEGAQDDVGKIPSK